jgi:hypothetical protein
VTGFKAPLLRFSGKPRSTKQLHGKKALAVDLSSRKISKIKMSGEFLSDLVLQASRFYFIIERLNFLSSLLLAASDNWAARFAASSAAFALATASADFVCALAALADACLTDVSKPVTCDCKFSISEVVAQAASKLKAIAIIVRFIDFFILFSLPEIIRIAYYWSVKGLSAD